MMRPEQVMRPRGFKAIGWIVIGILVGFLMVTLLGLLVDVFQLSILYDIRAGDFVSDEDIRNVDAGTTLVGGVQTLLLLISSVFVVIWTYQANVGARALGAHDMTFSPLASVVWYIVPIAYLWMPFRGMSEIWRVSEDPLEYKTLRAGSMLYVWWGAWILFSLNNRVVRALFGDAETINGFIWASALELASDIFVAVASVLLIEIIRTVTKRQDAWLAVS